MCERSTVNSRIWTFPRFITRFAPIPFIICKMPIRHPNSLCICRAKNTFLTTHFSKLSVNSILMQVHFITSSWKLFRATRVNKLPNYQIYIHKIKRLILPFTLKNVIQRSFRNPCVVAFKPLRNRTRKTNFTIIDIHRKYATLIQIKQYDMRIGIFSDFHPPLKNYHQHSRILLKLWRPLRLLRNDYFVKKPFFTTGKAR